MGKACVSGWLVLYLSKNKNKNPTRAGQLGWNVNNVCNKNRKVQSKMGEFSDIRLVLDYLGQVIGFAKGEGGKTRRFINGLAKAMMNG
jgi:hypothetical protein